jgi:hypothetical protein
MKICGAKGSREGVYCILHPKHDGSHFFFLRGVNDEIYLPVDDPQPGGPPPKPSDARSSIISPSQSKYCGNSSPHEPHLWMMPAIDSDSYWCPGVEFTGVGFNILSWNRPEHYGGEENPFEPIKIIEHYDLGFNLGNAVKYILRMGLKKGEPQMKDLKKAYTYIGFEIRRRERKGEGE